MIMNENVQHMSIHLSATLWQLIKPQNCGVWRSFSPGCSCEFISRCIGSQKRSWLPRPIRHVVMGTAIKAFGLDKNADAAEGDWGLGVKKKKEGGRER